MNRNHSYYKLAERCFIDKKYPKFAKLGKVQMAEMRLLKDANYFKKVDDFLLFNGIVGPCGVDKPAQIELIETQIESEFELIYENIQQTT